MIYNRIIIALLLIGTVCSSSFAIDIPKDKRSSNIQSVSEQRKFDYFFYEGLNLKAAGKYDAAFDLFSHCLEMDSTASPVLYELSFYYMQLKRPEKAISLLKNAVKYSNDNFTYRMALASLSRTLGMFGEAAEEYEDLVNKYPEKTELNFYLAESLTQQGEIEKAIEAYDALESAIGMSEALSIQKFRLLMEVGQKEKAYEEMEKLADKYPMEARYSLLLGDLYLENKEFDKALEYYNKAHSVDPSNPYYIVSMSNYYEATGNKKDAELLIKDALVNEKLDVETKVGILSRYIVRLNQSQQGTESANLLFDELIEQHPEDTELKLMYGSLLTAQEKNDDAKFQFQLVTEMEPENPTAWQQLLNLAIRSENYDEVIRICTTCIELFPEAPEFYFYLGIAHYQKEDYQQALATYYDGIANVKDANGMMKSDFYGQIGDIYYQIDDMPKAYEAYEEALKYNERNIVVLNNYSYFLSLDKKDLSKAEKMSLITIQMEPDNATYLDTYAWILFVQGNYSLAKIYIQQALDKDKTNSHELVDHYGDILYMVGDKEKAVEQWKRAKEMGKESEVLDRKIAEEKYFEE